MKLKDQSNKILIKQKEPTKGKKKKRKSFT